MEPTRRLAMHLATRPRLSQRAMVTAPVESMLRKADGISLVDPVQPNPRAARR
jgi:hypothetical protein